VREVARGVSRGWGDEELLRACEGEQRNNENKEERDANGENGGHLAKRNLE
jgi:hypothetical protein